MLCCRRRTGLSWCLLLLFLLPSLMMAVEPSTMPLNESETKSDFVQPLQWTRNIHPPEGGGLQADLWIPQTNGALWALDFSPNEEHIAAVDINQRWLMIWNITDGRSIMTAAHPDPLVDVIWLDNDHVMIGDSDDNLVVFEIEDDGGAWPMNASNGHQMSWTKGFTGAKDGFLWGMDLSEDGSRVVICGEINDPNIPGEIVSVETSYLTGGQGTPTTIYTSDQPIDCSISPNGSMVTTVLRNPSGIVNQDRVVAHNLPDLSPLWDRAIGGGEATAWAIDWEPNGMGYTIGWNRPSEGVVTHFRHNDGTIDWYSPIPQDVSSLEWSPIGDVIVVGLHDPGRLMIIDQIGTILNDLGWHSTVSGGSGNPADVLDVSVSNSGMMASAGRDGSIEIWNGPASAPEMVGVFGNHLTREVAMHPRFDLLAMADSSGTTSVRNLTTGSIERQCFHPDHGVPMDDIPYAKSVDWGDDESVLIGFSDGMIVACDEQGKNVLIHDLVNQGTLEVMGRVRYHSTELIVATYGENATNTSADGVVEVISISSGQSLRQWNYDEVYWTVAFGPNQEIMSSVSQSGHVRTWSTIDPDPMMWSDNGIAYNHENYSGANQWFDEFPVLVTGGWDSKIKMYDSAQQVLVTEIDAAAEIFDFALDSQGPRIIVGSGNSATSATGRIQIFDLSSSNLITSMNTIGIPRGIELDHDNNVIFVNHTGSVVRFVSDVDQDGVPDDDDAFPTDSTQHSDLDGDKFGDNPAGNEPDSCPNQPGDSYEDRYGCIDTDSDGWSDSTSNWLAHPLGLADAFPDDPYQWLDTDGDGVGDAHSFTIASNGMRIDSGDAFPNDSTQITDRDGDGCGDNYTYSVDDLGYRVPANGDAFPNDPLQCHDLDGDNIGDNYSYTVDPNTGLLIETGDKFPFDRLAWHDPDDDGCVPSSATDIPYDHDSTDPLVCAAPEETEPETNNTNPNVNVISFPIDNDGDGVLNQEDLCPNDAGLAANGGCPVTPSNDGNNIADESENQGEDVASSNSRALIVTIVLGLLMIGTVGFLILRNKEVNGSNSGTPIQEIERCPDCNGIAQEAVENGNRWTWCPECRKWLQYKGPAS